MTPSFQANKRSTTITILILLAAALCICALIGAAGGVAYWAYQNGKGQETFRPTRTEGQPAVTQEATRASTPTQVPMATTIPVTPTTSLTPTLGAGSTWVRPVDGMVMVYVPEGTFIMGSDEGDSNERPPHEVALDNYWIDQTEVTNAMFRAFVAASGTVTDAEQLGQGLVYQPGEYLPANEKWIKVAGADWMHPAGPGSGLEGLEDHPAVQVSWNDAMAYCQWAGGRLPTEAEWERAARGDDERAFPWGNQSPDGTQANSADLNLDAIWTNDSINDGYQFTAPVGSYPAGASPFGALDMAGNAAEWVADRYAFDYYSQSPYSNPTGPASGMVHVLRGGQWSYTADGIRSAARIGQPAKYAIDYTGFRCARTP